MTSNVAAARNSLSEKRYQYLHTQPSFSDNYYRLRAVDFSGFEDFSSTISVFYDQNGKVDVYPNPAKETLFVYSEQSTEIHLYDAWGQLIWSRSFDQNQRQTIEVGHLSAGVYFLK